jgi:hypothetical protein
VSAYGVPDTATDTVTSPLDALQVTTMLPGSLTAGTTLAYTVTLHNPTAQAVALNPCPSYEEFVWPLTASTKPHLQQYYLNCQAAASIPANGSVDFEMLVNIPSMTGTPSQAKYGWSLPGTTVQTGGTVTDK